MDGDQFLGGRKTDRRWSETGPEILQQKAKWGDASEGGGRQLRKDNGETRSEEKSHRKLGMGPAGFFCSFNKYRPTSYFKLGTRLWVGGGGWAAGGAELVSALWGLTFYRA